MEEKKWEKVKEETVKFENVGDTVSGTLVGREKGGLYGNDIYKLKSGDVTKTVFSTTVLESQMSGVSIGAEVMIKYVGEKDNPKKGQNNIKLFEVFTR